MFPNYQPSERDWQKDFQFENGNYQNECFECKLKFYGHKRRVICFKCSGNEMSFSSLKLICNENFKGDYKDMAVSIEYAINQARGENNTELVKKLENQLVIINKIIKEKDDATII